MRQCLAAWVNLRACRQTSGISMRWDRVMRDSRSRGLLVDVEDEVYGLIYRRPARTVAPLGPLLKGSSDEGNRTSTPATTHASTHGRTRGGVGHHQHVGHHPHAGHHPQDMALEDELAAALLGQLRDPAREEVLSRAAAVLSRLALGPGTGAPSGGHVSGPVGLSGHG